MAFVWESSPCNVCFNIFGVLLSNYFLIWRLLRLARQILPQIFSCFFSYPRCGVVRCKAHPQSIPAVPNPDLRGMHPAVSVPSILPPHVGRVPIDPTPIRFNFVFSCWSAGHDRFHHLHWTIRTRLSPTVVLGGCNRYVWARRRKFTC